MTAISAAYKLFRESLSDVGGPGPLVSFLKGEAI
jgi:hypothetical protein